MCVNNYYYMYTLIRGVHYNTKEKGQKYIKYNVHVCMLTLQLVIVYTHFCMPCLKARPRVDGIFLCMLLNDNNDNTSLLSGTQVSATVKLTFSLYWMCMYFCLFSNVHLIKVYMYKYNYYLHSTHVASVSALFLNRTHFYNRTMYVRTLTLQNHC